MSRRTPGTVDLARARAAEERIAQRLADNPHLRDRTAAMLAGDLECPGMDEKEQPEVTEGTHQLSIRLPARDVARADAMIGQAHLVPELRTVGSPNRSDILRAALTRGLTQIEQELRQPTLPGAEG